MHRREHRPRAFFLFFAKLLYHRVPACFGSSACAYVRSLSYVAVFPASAASVCTCYDVTLLHTDELPFPFISLAAVAYRSGSSVALVLYTFRTRHHHFCFCQVRATSNSIASNARGRAAAERHGGGSLHTSDTRAYHHHHQRCIFVVQTSVSLNGRHAAISATAALVFP